jgi:periplasmic divalent cation tolerance protein
MAEYIQVFTTTARRDEAQRIAQELVERRLAACVQVLGPIASTYRWKGAIETSDEWLCLIKSRAGLFPQIEAAIREVHPYELPEILAVPVVAGGSDYLAWLFGNTQPFEASS